MGKCKYCGKFAGLFSSSHKLCESLHNEKIDIIKQRVETGLHLMSLEYFAFDKEDLQKSYISVDECSKCVSDIALESYSQMLKSEEKIWTSSEIAFIKELVGRFPSLMNDGIICKVFCRHIYRCIETFEGEFNISDFQSLNEVYIAPYALTENDKKECYLSCFGKYVELLIQHKDIVDSDIQFISDYSNIYNVGINDLKGNVLYDNFFKLLVAKINAIPNYVDAQTYLQNVLASLNVDKIQLDPYAVMYFDKAIDEILEDGIVSPDEVLKVRVYKTVFGLQNKDLNQGGRFDKFLQLLTLQDLKNGQTPSYMDASNIPVVLGKTECVLWADQKVVLHQCKSKREYVGRSNGISVKIYKGVYYKLGAYKGKPIDHQYYDKIGEGILLYTNKNLIFYNPNKSVKIPYKKIVSLTPYSDGFKVHKDGANALPVIFGNIDSWFLMNLLSIIEV